MIPPRRSLAALVGLAAVSAAAHAQPRPDLSVARGAHVAARNCAACHALGLTGESPTPDAPAFRDLRLRYNPIALQRRLAVLPAQGHPAMPPRTLAASDIPDLVAYIQTLEPPRPTK